MKKLSRLVPLPTCLISSLLCLQTMAGCGTEVGNPTQPKPSTVFASNDQSASEVIAVHLDSVMDSSQDEVTSPTQPTVASLESIARYSLAPKKVKEPKSKPDSKKACQTLSDGSVFLTLNANGKLVKEVGYKKAANIENTVQGLKTISVSSNNGAVTCHANGKEFSINFDLLSELTIKTQQQNAISRAVDKASPVAAEILTSRFLSSNVSQEETLKNLGSDGLGNVKIQKLVKFYGQHNLKFIDKKANEFELQSEVETVEPLEIEITRSGTEVIEKKIVSGLQVSKLKNDSVLQMQFSNLLFTDGDMCMPSEGSITGTIYGTDGSTVIDTFKVTFADGEGTIKLASSTKEVPYLGGCQFK